MRPVFLCVFLFGCGGTIGGPDGGDSGSSDGPADQTSLDGDGGWTNCTSPTKQQVCDGPNACAHGACDCPVTGKDSPNAVHACYDSPGFAAANGCKWANDGFICVAPDDSAPDFFFDAEFDMGVLFASNGAADRVRYADFGLWTGAALPEPVTCPTLTSAKLCGGNCGGCPGSFICHGRAPLHPYGFCLPTAGPSASDTCDLSKNIACSGTQDKCFAFTVEASAQAVADGNSVCLPSDVCDDLAANLPGGASCK